MIGLVISSAEVVKGEMEEEELREDSVSATSRDMSEEGSRKQMRKKSSREGGWGAGMQLCVTCAFQLGS